MQGPFTDRHAALVIGGGFAVVIAVNLLMATLATRSHPGMVVENSYVASQGFNAGLEAGRRQKALGWTVMAATAGDRIDVSATDARGEPLRGARVTARFSHPLGRTVATDVVLAEIEPGRYAARHGLADGRWATDVELMRDGERYWLATRLQVSG